MLHIASKHNNIDVVKFLLSQGIGTLLRNEQGHLAIHLTLMESIKSLIISAEKLPNAGFSKTQSEMYNYNKGLSTLPVVMGNARTYFGEKFG